jgi:hypothetical protein
MEEVNPSSRLKRSPTAHAASSLKKNRRETSEPGNNYNAQPWQYRLWFGFHIMDECECFLPTPFGKDEQKSITTGSRTCCYKIYKLAFQAIGLLILFVRNWQCLKTKILMFLYHLSSHPQVVIICSMYTHDQ